jgi:hypothetical protein
MNGRPHTTHVFVGKFGFFVRLVGVSILKFKPVASHVTADLAPDQAADVLRRDVAHLDLHQSLH